MATNQARSSGPPRGGLSREVSEQLRRTYADGNHVNLASIIASAGLGDNDDLLADLIDADARLRLAMGLEVTLERYLDSIPSIAGGARPVALDTAIEMSIRAMSGRGEGRERAAEILISRFPQFARAIRTASVLSDVMVSTEGLRRSLATGGRELPQEFGPLLSDGRRRYELRELIGTGAHGSVFLAADRQLSDRDRPAWVAIKVMSALGAQDETRLADEATKARRIDHPNVVRVLDRGVSEDGEPYLAYEYVRGGDLTAFTAAHAGPVPERRAAEIVLQVARGLQAAHSAGLAHCDLKPANVLVNDAGEPKVADFGVAVRLTGRDPKAAYQRLGSMAFVAPEQFRGEEGALSPMADVYAAGGLLYWLLTRRYPNGESPEEVERNLEGPTRRYSAPDPAAGRRLDPDLAAICRRALCPDPKHRFASAEALASDLEAWLRHEPVRSRPPTLQRRVRLLAVRQPAAVALTGLLAISVCALVGWVVYTTQHTARLRLEHELDVARAQTKADSERLTQVNGLFNSALKTTRSFGRTADDWMPVMTVLETIAGPTLMTGPEGLDLWTSRIDLIKDHLATSRAEGHGNTVESLLWETVLAYWLVRTGDDAQAEPLLVSTRDRWSRLAAEDSWVDTIDTLLACVKGRRALNSGSRDAMLKASQDLESAAAKHGVWKQGRLVAGMALNIAIEIHGPNALNNPQKVRELQEARAALSN